MTIKGKVVGLVVASIFVAATTMVVIGTVLSAQFAGSAATEVNKLIGSQLDLIASDTSNLVHSQDEALGLQVKNGLHVALHLVKQQGGIKNDSGSTVTWDASNQFTKAKSSFTLPKLALGGTWLGQNKSVKTQTPLVDQVQKLVGGACTIFQRDPATNSFLRVATNIETKDGKRAIGTFIPQVNPDGKENPVVAALLKAEAYKGVAYVVNAWYLTVYSPIEDDHGTVIGAVFYGVKQESVQSLRNAINGITVGKSGHVFVLGGTGDKRGKYFLSPDGKQDGEVAIEQKDADGKPFIQNLVDTAIKTTSGAAGTVRYSLLNPTTNVREWHTARVTYYKPWDWVIVVDSLDQDYSAFGVTLSNGRNSMVVCFILIGLIAAGIGAYVATISAKRTMEPLNRMINAATLIADGDLSSEIQCNSEDEIGSLAKAFNKMIFGLREFGDMAESIAHGDLSVRPTPRSETDTLGISMARMHKTIEDLVSRMSDVSIKIKRTSDQLGDSSNQVGMNSVNISAGAQQLAVYTTQTAEVMSGLQQNIIKVANSSETQLSEIQLTNEELASVAEAVQGVSSSSIQMAESAKLGNEAVEKTIQGIRRISEQSNTAGEQISLLESKGHQIGEIVQTIEQISDRTNLLALNAAIEAARVGEHGRGFAIVADEVRKLAEESKNSAGQISKLIEEVKSLVGHAVTSIRATNEEVSHSTEQSDQTSNALADIVAGAQRVARELNQVTDGTLKMTAAMNSALTVANTTQSAAKTMTAETSKVTELVTNVASFTAESTSGAEALTDSVNLINQNAETLARQAAEMDRLISLFRLEGDEDPPSDSYIEVERRKLKRVA